MIEQERERGNILHAVIFYNKRQVSRIKPAYPQTVCTRMCVCDFFLRDECVAGEQTVQNRTFCLPLSLFHSPSFLSLPLFHRLLISHLSGRKHPVWQLSPATCLPALHPHTSTHLHRHASPLALIVCLIHKPGLVANPPVLGEVTGIVWW